MRSSATYARLVSTSVLPVSRTWAVLLPSRSPWNVLVTVARARWAPSRSSQGSWSHRSMSKVPVARVLIGTDYGSRGPPADWRNATGG